MRSGVIALLLGSVGCGDDDDGKTSVPDGKKTPARDAGMPDAGPKDIRSFAVAVLQQYDRAAHVTCPCKVEAGDFPSEEDCIRALGYNMTNMACLSDAFVPFDSATLREQLVCEEERGRLRNDCLASKGCSVEDMTPCFENALECPMFDAQVLTQVLLKCPGAGVFSR